MEMEETINAEQFTLGETVIKQNAMSLLGVADIWNALFWHAHGNWECVSEEDVATSGLKFASGFAFCSVYGDVGNMRIWVVTEPQLHRTTVYLDYDLPNDSRRYYGE